jgi:hypothetical protein
MDPRAKLDEYKSRHWGPLVLLTAGHLGLFTALADGPRRARDLAVELGLDARAVEIVLLALVAEGWLQAEGDDRFGLQPEYAAYLAPGGDDSLANIMEHHYYLLKRWVRLAEVVRSGKPIPGPEGGRSPEQLRAFICGMHDVARRSAEMVAARLDLANCRRLLDLGGGPATASIVFCQRFRELHCVVFDLPEVVPIAAERIAAAGLADRITTRSGDYLATGTEGDIGDGYDAVFVSNIIHSLSPEQTSRLMAKTMAALEPGGLLLVKEFFLADSRTEPSSAALFAVNMLVGTEGGKSYTWSETEAIVRSGGAEHCERIELPPTSGLLLARKPTA